MTPQSQNSDYIAVSIGELKTDIKHILDGVNDLRVTTGNQGKQLTALEIKTEVLATEIEQIKTSTEAAEEAAEKAQARRPPWTAIGAFVVAAFAALKNTLFPGL